MEAGPLLLLLNALLCASAPAPLEESQAALIFVEPFAATGDDVAAAELHRIAEELFVNALAATKKFTFAGAATEAQVEQVIRGTLGRAGPTYSLEVVVRRGEEEQKVSSTGKSSLEATVAEAAAAVAAMQRLTGYVVKREGDRIVIARGSEDGIAVGQRYRITDGGEEFEIVRVAPHTADGRFTGRRVAASHPGGPAGPVAAGSLGAVDVVFVIDTTGSMQEEIDGVRENCQRLADGLAGKGIDANLSLVTFRVGVEDIQGPTASAALFKSWLAPLRAGGGGDETPFGALERSTDLRFRPAARRVFVLITDEPAYDAIASTTTGTAWDSGLGRKVLELLTSTDTVVFAATVDDPQGIYRELARATGGTFYDLEHSQDFTVLLDKLGKRIEGMFIEL